MCSSISSKPMRSARLAAETKASRMRSMSASVTSRGVCQFSPNGSGEAAMVCHGSASSGNALRAFPRPLRRALAAGMRDLDAELRGAGPARRLHDARERGFVVVGVKPEAAVRDAAGALDMGCFHNDQRGAGIGQHAEMHQVPVIGAAVVGGILAHRRNDNAVGKPRPASLIGEKRALLMEGNWLFGEAGNSALLDRF